MTSPTTAGGRAFWTTLLGVLFLGGLFVDVTGLYPLSAGYDIASRSVDRSLEQNAKIFASLSTIKAAMGMIEGSSVGASLFASVTVEAGDLIEPAYDSVNFVWHIFVYVLFLLTFYRLLLQSGILGLGAPLIGLGLLALAFDTWRAGRGSGGVFGKAMVAGGVFVLLLLPVALLLSDYVHGVYLEPLESDVVQRLEKMATELSSIKREILKGGVEAAAATASKGVIDLVQLLFTYLSILLLELLAIPLTVLGITKMAGGEAARFLFPFERFKK